MKYTSLLALLLISCPKPIEPIVPVPDSGTGGNNIGGNQSTGGNGNGGTIATGGQTQGEIEWPTCTDEIYKVQKKDIEKYRKLLRKPYPMRKHPKASYVIVDNLPDVFWLPLAPTLEQRRGSCTANAVLQSRISQPWSWTGSLDPNTLQDLADDIYSGATKRDPFPGVWPPEDTGSNGESALAEAKDRGILNKWVSVLSFAELQQRLQLGPCIIGTNWYTSMFSPDRCGQVSIGGIIEGGHEWTIKGVQGETKRILGLNSWGDGYGAKLRGQGGFFWVKFGDIQRLLNEGGEIECIIQ